MISNEDMQKAIQWTWAAILKTDHIKDERVREVAEWLNNEITAVARLLESGNAQIRALDEVFVLKNRATIARGHVRIEREQENAFWRVAVYPRGRYFSSRKLPLIVIGLDYCTAEILPNGSSIFYEGADRQRCSNIRNIRAKNEIRRVMRKIQEDDCRQKRTVARTQTLRQSWCV